MDVGTGGDGKLGDVLDRTGLRDLLRRPTQALSVGEQQRTALAAVLTMQPRLLILDEPTMGQDRHHLGGLMELVRSLGEEGRTVLLITHDRELVTRCADRVWEMMEGSVRARTGS
jgi:energy-coupling factor transport system ATP-binding protein